MVLWIWSEGQPLRSWVILIDVWTLLGGGRGCRCGGAPGRSCWRGCCQSGVAGRCWGGVPADLAEVVAVDVTSLADDGIATVGVADLADAAMAFPADPAGVVTDPWPMPG